MYREDLRVRVRVVKNSQTRSVSEASATSWGFFPTARFAFLKAHQAPIRSLGSPAEAFHPSDDQRREQ